MISFTTAFVAAALATGILAIPVELESAQVGKRSTANGQGTSGGFFYQFWSDGTSGDAEYTNGNGGDFSVTWTNIGDFTSGKGWSEAQPRNITFNGNVKSTGDFYVAVYTWSPEGENYILENYGSYDPCSQGTNQGTITSDGSDYTYCLVNRGNNYLQNWSVRQNKRSSGTVTTANHYNYYAAHGNANPLSAASYQILSVEAFGCSGSASATVGEAAADGTQSGYPQSSPQPSPPSLSTSSTSTSPGVYPTAPPPASSSTTPAAYPTGVPPPPASSASSSPLASAPSPSDGCSSCSALYGQCGGQKWNGATCCQSGSTCMFQNPYYSQCL